MTLIQALPQSADHDIWKYNWGDKFSSSRAYKLLKGHQQVHIIHKWLWEYLCQPKHKVFFWLLIKDRLSTRNILKRRNMQLPSYTCVLCLQDTEETCCHLFLHCPFAVHCWQIINVNIPQHLEFPEIAFHFRASLNSQFFMSAVILICWSIWTTRNNLIFKGIPPSIVGAQATFRKELLLLQHRVKPSASLPFDQWFQSLLGFLGA